jgi:hypothetical protein
MNARTNVVAVQPWYRTVFENPATAPAAQRAIEATFHHADRSSLL